MCLCIFSATSEDITIHWLICDGVSQGYHPVVMNYRGCAGVPLKVSNLTTIIIFLSF